MDNIDLELCKVFFIVAEAGNITKGAEKLFISQPAVSKSIQKLEEQVGGVLFLRSNKGLVLTEEGKVFLSYVKSALNLIGNAKIEINNFKELKEGVVNIGCSTTLAKSVLLKPLKSFHEKYPNIGFNIINELTKNLLLDLEKGNLDFVIMNEGDAENKNFEVTSLLEVENAFLFNPNYFSFNYPVALQDLSSLPLILQKKQANSRQYLEKICLENKVELSPKMEVVSQELVVELAKIGMGIAFAPVYEQGDLKKIELTKPIPASKILLVTNKFFSLSFASKCFIETIKKEYEK